MNDTKIRCIHCGSSDEDKRTLIQGGGPHAFCSVCMLDAVCILASQQKYPFTKMLQYVSDDHLQRRLDAVRALLPERLERASTLHRRLSDEERMLIGELVSRARMAS